jgi:hypothetical protein
MKKYIDLGFYDELRKSVRGSGRVRRGIRACAQACGVVRAWTSKGRDISMQYVCRKNDLYTAYLSADPKSHPKRKGIRIGGGDRAVYLLVYCS